MNYFVTGATGFIGRNLVSRLLQREGTVYALVRAGSRGRLEELRTGWGADGARVVPIAGDLAQPGLGISEEDLVTLRGSVDHFFHLAAIYDMTADAETQEIANVEGTRHAVELAGAIDAGCFHQVSSIAAAGLYRGEWREDMFEEAEKLDTHPYFRTKHESERVVREESTRPWRVYRPGIVVGDSRTGEIDKVDGPYYMFKLLQQMRRVLPSWLPTVGIEGGEINIVPVDFVADAIDHIAHQPGLDGQAFSLTDPNPKTAGELLNLFAKEADAPQAAYRLDSDITEPATNLVKTGLRFFPPAKRVAKLALGEVGIPAEVLSLRQLPDPLRLDQRAGGAGGLGDRGAAAGELRRPDLGLLGAQPRPRACSRTARCRAPCGARSSSSPAPPRGSARRRRSRSPTPAPPCCSSPARWTSSRRPKPRSSGPAASPTSTAATCRTSRTSSGWPTRCSPTTATSTSSSTTPGRSIRRSVELAYDRFHDYERTMQVNYFGAVRLILALLPAMQARKSGHIINISSIGTQTNPPRFSAYVASKAALDAFSRVIASEVIDDGIHLTTIHMPLVRTPMIAPTRMYDVFPAITPEEAAEMIAGAMVGQPKKVATRLGTFGELLYAVAPKTSDKILNTRLQALPRVAGGEGQRRREAPDRAPTHRGARLRAPDERRSLVGRGHPSPDRGLRPL